MLLQLLDNSVCFPCNILASYHQAVDRAVLIKILNCRAVPVLKDNGDRRSGAITPFGAWGVGSCCQDGSRKYRSRALSEHKSLPRAQPLTWTCGHDGVLVPSPVRPSVPQVAARGAGVPYQPAPASSPAPGATGARVGMALRLGAFTSPTSTTPGPQPRPDRSPSPISGCSGTAP